MSRTWGVVILFCLFASMILAQKKDAGAYDLEKKYTPETLKSDLHVLEKALKEAHPGLYTYRRPQEIDNLFDSVYASLTTAQTELQFFSTISFLCSKIGCGHTPCFLSRKYMSEYAEKTCKYFPFKIKLLDKHLFVLSNLSTDSSLVPGTELLAINGLSVREILDRILPHLASDGYNQTLKYHITEEEFMYYYAELIAQPTWFSIQVKLPGDELMTGHMIPALNLKELGQITQKRFSKTKPPLIEKPLQFRLTDDKTGILSIGSFDGGDISAAHQHFRSFIKNAFDTLRTRGANDLIIDLRNNGGGDDDLGWYLYSFLTDSSFQYYERVQLASNHRFSFLRYTNEPLIFNFFHLMVTKDRAGRCVWTRGSYTMVHKPHPGAFDGAVFILINGKSFSTTAEFSSVVHAHDRAVFVGEETGGAQVGNNSGMELMLTLPTTGLRIKIPLMKYVCAVPPPRNPRQGYHARLSNHPYDR